MRLTQKKKNTLWKLALTLLVCLIVFLVIMPFLYMLSMSFKTEMDVRAIPYKWIPDYFYIDNYRAVWNLGEYGPESRAQQFHLSTAYLNTIKVTVINTVTAVLTSSLAGYAFAKIKFRGRNILFMICLATLMVPSQVTLIPKFIVFKKLGMLNNHVSLILPGIVSAIGIFLMRQAYLTIPDSLREAAYIDGASEFKIWLRVMLPLTKSTMGALATVLFMTNWNCYMEALVFLTKPETQTLAVAMGRFASEDYMQYNLIMAAMASGLLPICLVFLAGQRFFVKGIIAGAVKE